MARPKITFFMIAYNAEKYIRKAIGSILGQTEKNILLLVRNNGSTDGTGRILREIADSDPRLHIYENRLNWKYSDGTSFMRDGVVRVWPVEDKDLLGEYISIADADDWLKPTFAEKMYRAAKSVDADIAVCGSTFLLDGVKVCGERLPPDITTRDLPEASKAVEENYAQLHNSFRTWWAKLFRTEFFLRYYDEAWRAVGGENGHEFDTVIMLRYLCRAKSLACVPSALYCFRMSSGSTYGNRPPVYYRVLEAEALFTVSTRFLRTFHADSPRNTGWLIELHWAYVNESLQCLSVGHPGFTARQELSFIAMFLNSPVQAQYYAGNVEAVFQLALRYTKIVLERGGKNMSLYSSFLTRLSYLADELEKGSRSLLLYPVLMGCVYDRENARKIGLHLLPRVAVSPQFEKFLPGIQTFQSHEMNTPTACPCFWPRGIPEKLDTSALEQQLDSAVGSGDYETACNLIEKISAVNPLNRSAMYYRIQMARLAQMNELCAVLAGTAVSLWPADAEMQSLCWEILQDPAADEN